MPTRSAVHSLLGKCLVGVAALGVAAFAAEPAKAPDAHGLRVFWQDGLWSESPSTRISLKIGGRVMADWGWMDEDSDLRAAVGSLNDHTELRRLRLYGKGRIGDHVDFKLEGEFAGSGRCRPHRRGSCSRIGALLCPGRVHTRSHGWRRGLWGP